MTRFLKFAICESLQDLYEFFLTRRDTVWNYDLLCFV